MAKNDYRRALIMLRSHRKGYSGHVRMERRVMTGSLYFVVTVPQEAGELGASLVRRDRKGNYAAAFLGTLRRDGRGQANLAYSFDPRAVDGRPLDEYLMVVVTRREGGECGAVLSGNIDGAREVDWDAVQSAARAACGGTEERAAELPEAEAQEDAPEVVVEDAETDINTDAPWQGASEAFRAVFAKQPVTELMLGDGFTYALAPMPEESGYDQIALGVRCEAGVPKKIAYALKGSFAEEPPEGLEGYRWIGGSAEGWWVLYADADTGAPL